MIKTVFSMFGGALMAAAVTSAALPAPALAAPPVPAQQKSQVPGFYRFALGGFEITALYDGYIDLKPELFGPISATDMQSLLARMFAAKYATGLQTAVNAYLVHTGDHLVLVDTGTATAFGPTLGHLVDNIRASGYDPAQVDTVLLTHLHPDHALGLLNAQGGMAFPNAQIRVARAEAAYWLDPKIAAASPKDAKPFFKMADDAVAPYRALGRLTVFDAGDVLLPGIKAVSSPGHTPGHTSYLLQSADQSLLVWGDIVHNHAVQFARPDVAIEFDSDKAKAVETRREIFKLASGQALWVAGAHLPFPGIGHVRADKDGFAWVPVEFAPIRGDQ